MAAVATHTGWQLSQQPWHPHDPRPRFQYATQPQPRPPSAPLDAPIPLRNEKEMNREMLIMVLTHFSTLIPSCFNRPVRLVVHGGACMLLHPGLYNLALQQHHMLSSSPSNSQNAIPRRTTTRDVDYIKRSFAAEWQSIGMADATERLQSCIQSTARRFQLGADWMNSDADVALPMANDPSGKSYDPIYTASIQPNNVHLHTVFTSPNGMLTLVSVTPFWAVALKLVRYTKWDPGDICLLLRNGTNLSGTQWSPQMLETWLYQQCWPMGYGAYDWRKKGEMKARIAHAIQMVSIWNPVPALGNPVPTAVAEKAVGSNAKADWEDVDPNPPFVPPPLSRPPTNQDQKDGTGNGWLQLPQHPQGQRTTTTTGGSWPDPLPPQSIHRRSRSQGPTPDPDDWEMVSLPRPKSRQIHGTPHPTSQTQLQPYVEQFDRSIATMLHADRGPVLPSGVFAKKNDMTEASSRRKRDKKRSGNRKRDRLSKLFRRGYDSADGGSESDDPDDGRDRSKHLHPLDLNCHLAPQDGQQQFRRHLNPHSSAWQIYSQPAASQSQSFAPPRPEPHAHQPEDSQGPEMDTRHHRHRPTALDLSDTEVLSNSLGLLNFRQ